jgi:hypothetical protein
MKKMITLLTLILISLSGTRAPAQMVTPAEAVMIANKYIRMAVDSRGDWGGDSTIRVNAVNELMFEGKRIGYYCNILPSGVIVLSLRKEFSPVKACSDKGFLDTSATDGLVALVRSRMAAHIRAVENTFGPIDKATTQQVESVLEFSCRDAWDQLASYIPGSLTDELTPYGNYDEGEALLTSEWDQKPPYNNECLWMNCSNTSNGKVVVGCVATAGAQLMRYWCWPPFAYLNPTDPYEWSDMRDDVDTNDPAPLQAAVAELSHDLGVQVGMDYGCTSSGAPTEDMEGVYEQNLYNSICAVLWRENSTPEAWWALIKGQLNINMPIHYRIEGHSIVCDGWDETVGYPTLCEYHMNYGWESSWDNTWYTLDQLPGSPLDEEYMLVNILPNCALGSTLSGLYFGGYHYVNMEASGSQAIFSPGSFIQTLPLMVIKGTGTTTVLKFLGTPGSPTRIFTNGTSSIGINIANGGITLKNDGCILMHKPEE